MTALLVCTHPPEARAILAARDALPERLLCLACRLSPSSVRSSDPGDWPPVRLLAGHAPSVDRREPDEPLSLF